MPRGRPRRWPWDLWLNGEKHILVAGTDFTGVDSDMLRQQVLNEARKRGVEIETRLRRDAMGPGIDVLGIRGRQLAPKPRIDWDEVLAKLPTQLRKGTDFDCSVEAMRVRAYQAAQRRDLRIRTKETHVGVLSIYPAHDDPATEMAPAKEAIR